MPAAGYPLHRLRVAGIDRTQPAAGGAARCCWRRGATGRARAAPARDRGRRGARRRRLRGRAGRAGGADAAAAAGADRGGQPPRRVATGCWRRSPRACAWRFRSRGGTGAKWLVTGRPGSARHRERRPDGRPGAARRSARRALPARVRRLARGAPPERRGAGGVRRRGALHGAARRGAARLRRPARAPRRARLAGALPPVPLHRAVRGRARRRGPRGRPAPAARCSSSRPPACPSILVPYPHATGDHQDANARFMERRGRGGGDPRRRARRRRGWPARWAACSAAPQRMAEMSNAARAVARPDAGGARGPRAAAARGATTGIEGRRRSATVLL